MKLREVKKQAEGRGGICTVTTPLLGRLPLQQGMVGKLRQEETREGSLG